MKTDIIKTQKKEALDRLGIIGADKMIAEHFKRTGEPLVTDMGAGVTIPLDGKLKELVKAYEAESGAAVYHVIFTPAEMAGDMAAFLAVSKYLDEWEMEREDLQEGYPIIYVENISEPLFSEYGSIGVKAVPGGLVRTA